LAVIYIEKGNNIFVGNKNFIEINGKKYDAITGVMVHDSDQPINKPVTTVSPAHNIGVVDGFVRRQRPAVQRTVAQPATKQVQKSSTLMRNAVHKPASVVHKVKSEKPVIQKSHLGTSSRRTETALQTPKSSQVSKFEHPAHRSSVVKTMQPGLAVKQQAIRPAPTVAPAHVPQAHAPQTNHHAQPHTRSVAAEKMINAALANAHSHESTDYGTKITKKRSKFIKKLGISRRTMSTGSAALAVVLLVGFFAIQNVPNLSMRVAATRAGFDASMPGYKPAGFSFKGPIKYSPGEVSVAYASNTDARAYEVKQKASNWNSDALRANFVETVGKQYQTFQDRGRTLYIYDKSNATWVDDGVWYTVEGESDMTTDQLIRIASSI
jgi:hypothetical protein